MHRAVLRLPVLSVYSGRRQGTLLNQNLRTFSASSNTEDLYRYLAKHVTVLNVDESKEQKLYAKMLHELEPVYGRNMQTAQLESFGTKGLNALAETIHTQHQAPKSGGRKARVRFKIPHHKTEFILKWSFENQNLLDLIRGEEGAPLLSEYIEATCGGNSSCCTCHVYVAMDETPTYQLSQAEESELDMLDLAYEPTDRSRLACQVRLTERQHTTNDDAEPLVTVTIPASVNNVWN